MREVKRVDDITQATELLARVVSDHAKKLHMICHDSDGLRHDKGRGDVCRINRGNQGGGRRVPNVKHQ